MIIMGNDANDVEYTNAQTSCVLGVGLCCRALFALITLTVLSPAETFIRFVPHVQILVQDFKGILHRKNQSVEYQIFNPYSRERWVSDELMQIRTISVKEEHKL